jgi:predicted  nucleic acid-binding Zn-ribbon protein
MKIEGVDPLRPKPYITNKELNEAKKKLAKLEKVESTLEEREPQIAKSMENPQSKEEAIRNSELLRKLHITMADLDANITDLNDRIDATKEAKSDKINKAVTKEIIQLIKLISCKVPEKSEFVNDVRKILGRDAVKFITE